MRPAYRFAAVALVALVGAGVGWLLFAPDAPEPPVHVPLQVAAPPGATSGSPVSAETVLQMLDRVEAAEVERFGEAEAARRRKTREQLIESRLHPEHP